jgi:hypothetical protein
MRSFRSKQVGWFNESWRHGLAARGVKTNYYASKSPGELAALSPSNQMAPETTKVVPSLNEDKAGRGFKSARTAVQEELAERQLKKLKEDELRASQPEQMALRAIQEGRYYDIIEGTNKSAMVIAKETGSEQITQALRMKAIQNAQAGLPVPDAIKGSLDKETLQTVKDIQAQRKS